MRKSARVRGRHSPQWVGVPSPMGNPGSVTENPFQHAPHGGNKALQLTYIPRSKRLTCRLCFCCKSSQFNARLVKCSCHGEKSSNSQMSQTTSKNTSMLKISYSTQKTPITKSGLYSFHDPSHQIVVP